MMRHGFSLGSAPALALIGALVLAASLPACGGSSSETPPPLQPDPHGFHYAGVSATERETSDAGPDPVSNDSDDDDKPRAPARSTWGAAPAPRH